MQNQEKELERQLRNLTFEFWQLKHANQRIKSKQNASIQEIRKIRSSKRFQIAQILAQIYKNPFSLFNESIRLGNLLIKRLLNQKKNEKTLKRKVQHNYHVGISIIIPTYRKNPYLKECIESVLNQNYNLDKLEIIIVVNGPQKKLLYSLKDKYKGKQNVKVVYTSKQGASVARNYGLNFVSKPFLTFLDDDDYLTPYFLKDLTNYIREDVNIICGRRMNYIEKKGSLCNTTTNKVLKRLPNGGYTEDYKLLSPLLSSPCGKLFRSQHIINDWERFDPKLKHTEDVIFWVENLKNLEGPIGCVKWNSSEAYIRRVRKNSTSRPSKENMYKFAVTDRIKIIERITETIYDPQLQIELKDIARDRVEFQNRYISNYFKTLNLKLKKKAFREVEKCNNSFLNKSLFAFKSGICFSHNFPPDVDTAAYVAAKRLREINNLKKHSISWDVISKDMSNCCNKDQTFYNYYVKFLINSHLILPGPAYVNEISQTQFAYEASKVVEKLNYDYIYSRSMPAGSHIAAYLYKKTHPEAYWYAEFSDPLYMNSYNEKSKLKKREEWKGLPYIQDYWRYVERTVYEHADKIIFTNKNQREYMLEYNEDPKTKKCVLEKSIVLNHPQLDKKFTQIYPSNYYLPDDKINIGYFGRFYPNRNHEDIIKLINNPNICLHLFVPKIQDLEDYKNNKQIKINSFVSHFEFLNIASKMDYLFLNDMDYKGEINPYLPSKIADYLSSGSDIIAKVIPGSPLSKIQHKNLIKVKELTENFINNL